MRPGQRERAERQVGGLVRFQAEGRGSAWHGRPEQGSRGWRGVGRFSVTTAERGGEAVRPLPPCTERGVPRQPDPGQSGGGSAGTLEVRVGAGVHLYPLALHTPGGANVAGGMKTSAFPVFVSEARDQGEVSSRGVPGPLLAPVDRRVEGRRNARALQCTISPPSLHPPPTFPCLCFEPVTPLLLYTSAAAPTARPCTAAYRRPPTPLPPLSPC